MYHRHKPLGHINYANEKSFLNRRNNTDAVETQPANSGINIAITHSKNPMLH
jgi:hypothetical protein